ncbi:MFS transporter [Roseomonas sp. NAR14]|uniref:MFS transporter n=1 Tax=Roseomonas acroporae TaxID=2937791 RepID=A0A9X2BV46_9PROT|nr:MFS transporter [Roseomonas acroporae]MCK8786282.1 MFS transporter [Roseomonas acroporae]
MATAPGGDAPATAVDSRQAWLRLAVTVLVGTIGSVGMWSVVVALPAVQAEFGSARGAAALPYTLTMLGFALGSVLMGRLVDRFGVAPPLAGAAVAIGLGYLGAAASGSLWQFTLAQGLVVALCGSSIAFSPLIADISRWFLRRRGIAVAAVASANYLAGTIWPPVVQHFIEAVGWRATHAGIGLLCTATLLPLALLLRQRAPAAAGQPAGGARAGGRPGLGLPPGVLQGLLVVAGLACCVAMSMPQAHIVAYCGDLGYGVARGTTMLSLMLGFGIVSRLASGLIVDRIGGLPTVLLGSSLQGVALLLYLFFDGLGALYVVSALFGLFQGGIVPSYAIVVRENFPAEEAGVRVGLVLMATMLGMALGGWLSGVIFDLTGSYHAAFLHGLLWNLLNVSIVAWLLRRGATRRGAPRAALAGLG